ncbi:MAG: M28 family peptidase [Massilia sp.]
MLTNRFGPAAAILAGLIAVTLCARALPVKPMSAQAFGAAPAASSFSASQAMANVEALAQSPRPIASAANTEAREYLLARLRALGLDPQVQRATVQRNVVDRYGHAHVTLAVVNNVLVHLPGTAPGYARQGAVLLATRYDSGAQSVGASAAAPAAALLESLRVLRAGPPLNLDLICLFADGEQIGDFGSRGFAEQHPWARQVGVVLKFDSHASRGPVLLTDTSGASGEALRAWAEAAPRPLGSSFMRSVVGLGPMPLSIGPLGGLGVAGLQFANVEGNTGRSGALDTVGRLDIDTVQDMGDTMLATVRRFAEAPIAAGAERVYFNLPGVGLVHYPVTMVWPLTRLACLMFAALACLTWRRERVMPATVAAGAAAYGAIAALMALAAWILWQIAPLILPVQPDYAPLRLGSGVGEGWYLLGFVALASGVFILLRRAIAARVGASGAALGALFCMLVLLVVVSAWQLAASYILVWPLMAAMAAFATRYAPGAQQLGKHYQLAVRLAGLLPGAILAVPLLRHLYTVFTPEYLMLPIAVLAMLLALGTTLLTLLRRRYVVRVLAAASLGCMAMAGTARPYGDAPPPKPNRLVYYTDTGSADAWWLLPPGRLDGWSKRFFPDALAPRVPSEVLGVDARETWIARAPRHQVDFPRMLVTSYRNDNRERHIGLLLQSKSAAPSIEVRLQGAGTNRVTLGDRVLSDARTVSWGLTMYGMRDESLNFKFDIDTGPIVRFKVEEKIQGLPAVGADDAPGTIPLTATTIVADSLRFD